MSIHGACSKEFDPVTCYLREVLDRFIQSQPVEHCNETVEKIVIGLDKLGSRYVKEATELRTFATGEYCLINNELTVMLTMASFSC